MEISMAIMIDHNDGCIIYGEIEIVTQLESYLGLEMRQFTLDQDFINELHNLTVRHPSYSFARAQNVLAKVNSTSGNSLYSATEKLWYRLYR